MNRTPASFGPITQILIAPLPPSVRLREQQYFMPNEFGRELGTVVFVRTEPFLKTF
jgi:hypothetical protein